MEVYWAAAHSTGYKARYCEFCHQQLETTKKPKWMNDVFEGVKGSKFDLRKDAVSASSIA